MAEPWGRATPTGDDPSGVSSPRRGRGTAVIAALLVTGQLASVSAQSALNLSPAAHALTAAAAAPDTPVGPEGALSNSDLQAVGAAAEADWRAVQPDADFSAA